MTLKSTSKKGFTIVELLVVIVVVAILASISVAAYSGVQKRAQNTMMQAEFVQWKKLFMTYEVMNGKKPTMATGGYCLGTGFPDGKCRDYEMKNQHTYTEAASTALMNELKTVSSLPGAPRVPINGTVGPYVNYNSGWVTLTMVIHGQGADDCPDGTDYVWADGNGRLLCSTELGF